MRLYQTKNVYKIRLCPQELKSLDPLLDRQFIKVKHVLTLFGATILSFKIMDRVKKKYEKHALKVYWHTGTTAELRLAHRELRLPKQLTKYTGFKLFNKYYLMVR